MLHLQLLRGVGTSAESGLLLLVQDLLLMLLLLQDHRGVLGRLVPRSNVVRDVDRRSGHQRTFGDTCRIHTGRATVWHRSGGYQNRRSCPGHHSPTSQRRGPRTQGAAKDLLGARGDAQSELVEYVGEEGVQAAVCLHVGPELSQLKKRHLGKEISSHTKIYNT